MNYSLLRRGWLAATLGLAMFAGLARADDKPAKPTVADKVVSTEVVAEDDSAAPGHPKRLGLLRSGALKDKWQNRTPILCYGNFNDYSCSSLHSELAFIFSGCRFFYGERCLKGPPPSPVPGFDPVALGLEYPARRGCKNCR